MIATRPVRESIPNLAPMVDVIMVLLVFFLLQSAVLLTPEGVLQTELDPRSGPAEGELVSTLEAVNIFIRDLGDDQIEIYFGDRRLEDNSFDGLRNRLRQLISLGYDAGNPAVIGASDTTAYKHVIAAMDACLSSGFENVQFEP